jgi:hypothetical protein
MLVPGSGRANASPFCGKRGLGWACLSTGGGQLVNGSDEAAGSGIWR